ncbi:hypothetical protein PghCCS26_49160 [Paenibacillus glycanilyticus]|uniref:Uncharacterized protein n=1 Tax=Paenibacillus glycanilyticus TaxID=126569 RepID=A0ABQ6NRR7_9BACL|nr:hypothetical protein PghCCS26_49160 [Paenibacillus glycanilyticus]
MQVPLHVIEQRLSFHPLHFYDRKPLAVNVDAFGKIFEWDEIRKRIGA